MKHAPRARRHIALFLPDLRAGGAQKVLLTLAERFSAQGIQVDLVVAILDGELVAEVPPGVRVLALTRWRSVPGRVLLAVRACVGLIRYFQANRPDALLSTLTGANLVASIAHRIARVPTRLVLREGATLNNIGNCAYYPLMRFCYGRAAAVVVLTNIMKEEMVRVIGLSPERVMSIPNPVDAKQVYEKAGAPLPEDFETGQPYALAVGRLWAQKDYGTLIQAFSSIARACPLRLVILGEGPERSGIESQIRQLSLEDRIDLRGYDPNPYRWMARACFFVLSSRWEGYPNVVAESRALGCPIVMTEYDMSAREIGGEDAVLVPVNNAEELAQGMLQAFRMRGIPKTEFTSNRDIARDYLRILGIN